MIIFIIAFVIDYELLLAVKDTSVICDVMQKDINHRSVAGLQCGGVVVW